jgi:type 1 glutamine amidotransferase
MVESKPATSTRRTELTTTTSRRRFLGDDEANRMLSRPLRAPGASEAENTAKDAPMSRIQRTTLRASLVTSSLCLALCLSLPSGRAEEELTLETALEERLLPVSGAHHQDGALRIGFSNGRGPNAVVSEVWLRESIAGEPVVGLPAEETPTEKEREKEREKEKASSAKTRVLILTGNDYPGHKWRETAPVLARQLRADPRLEVEVVEDPSFLASPKLAEYRVVVLHWMNWETPDPGPQARENLRTFVEKGGGLFPVHFACGAFQEWPEFRNLAGRSYDPKLRGHDPHGAFTVEITKVEHPVTKGLKAFLTVDELYTCLAGDRPVEILATARSKVDGKDYPIAFAFSYGKGRVFHSPLGHDVKALEVEAVGDLFRRGCAWAAGLPPARE